MVENAYHIFLLMTILFFKGDDFFKRSQNLLGDVGAILIYFT